MTEGCHVLLLILAEAMPRAEQGLKVLDEAVKWHPATCAYHLRRAACLARLGDEKGAEREGGAADSLPPVTAFDQFLTGQERYERGRWDEFSVISTPCCGTSRTISGPSASRPSATFSSDGRWRPRPA